MDDVREVLNFILIGPKHSGRTVYLSTLFGAEKSIVADNNDTKEYLEKRWNDMTEGNKSVATAPGLVSLDFAYNSETYSVRFSVNDYRGYLEEAHSRLEEDTQGQLDRLKENIQATDGLLFFFPYEKESDKEAMENFKHQIDAFIDLVREVYPDMTDISIPVAIAVTKWDESLHYGRSNEEEKAIQYIRATEAYRSARDKITTYFSKVKVFTVSSFGPGEDGMHLAKDPIKPHNITSPLDYFLEDFFEVVARRCDTFQKIGNLPGLFKFIHQRYRQIGSYEDGKYQKLFEEVQQQYADRLLSELGHASSVEEKKLIVKNHKYFIENVENQEAAKNVAIKVSETRLQGKQKTFITAVVLILALVGIGYVGGLYLKSRGEKSLMIKMEESGDAKPREILTMARTYLANYQSNTLLMPYSIDDRRRKVERIQAKAESDIQEWLRDRFHRLGDLQLTEENLQKVRALRKDARLFPDFEIASEIEHFSGKFCRRFVVNQKKYQRKQDTMARAKAILASAEPDERRLKEMLKRVRKLKGDGDTNIMIRQLTEKLRSIQAQKRELARTDLFAKARILSESAKPGENDLKETLKKLRALGKDREGKELINQLTKKLRSIQAQRAFANIRNLLKQLAPDAEAGGMKNVVIRNWDDHLTREHRDILKKIIDKKVLDKDSKDIRSLGGEYESIAEVKKDKNSIRKIRENELNIPRLNQYHYVRSPELRKKLGRVVASINACESALRGIKVSVEFIAQNLDNRPLGFRCEGWRKEKDIILRLDNEEFHYKHDNGKCSSDMKGQQRMKWQKPLTLKHKKYHVMVSEWDAFGSEHIEGEILVTEGTLFNIHNRGFVELTINGTEYSLRFQR